VECVWRIEAAAPIRDYPVRPDGCLDILYSRTGGLQVVGTMTTERRFELSAGAVMAGIRFRPGMARAFIGVSPAELTDRTAAFDDVMGRAARTLQARLDDAPSADQCLTVLATALPVPDQPSPNPVQQAIAAIAHTRGQADLDRIAAQANLSPRQFRRRCREESGLTPKRLCRVLRFRHAATLAESGSRSRPDWAAIAAEAGYFDQAHLVRDFREFTGRTPMSVFSNTAPAALA